MPEEHHDEDQTRSIEVLAEGTKVGHYIIISKIGAGGMGEVYLAEDKKLNRKVALKFLPVYLNQDEDYRKRFTREAQAAAQLNHPNIVTIFEVSDYNGRPFFAMEYIDGQSFHGLTKKTELGVDHMVDLARQICEGLKAAHDSGIIHRDIKPSNIVLDAGGRPRLLDFGLAAVEGTESLTKAGSTLGTIGYMSPEQIKANKVTPVSDLFSFGAVLYELITRKPAFSKDNTAATLNAILNDSPEKISKYRKDIPEVLQSIVAKALRKDATKRYQSADELLNDLSSLYSKSGSTLVTRLRIYPRKIPRRLFLPGFILVAMTAFLVLNPWNIRFERSQPAEAAANLLAIPIFMNICDVSDSARTAQMVTSLLIADLTESKYIRVVSRERFLDIMENMGIEDIKTIDRELASQISKQARARWMIKGEVIQTVPNIVLSSDITEIATGKVLASQRVSGDPDDNIFAVVDRLTSQIRKDLDIPKLYTEDDVNVASVTTNSPQAYRYYIEASEQLRKMHYTEGKRSLLKALEFDSTFAIVYYVLASSRWFGMDQFEMINKAVEYSENCGVIEKHLIYAMHAKRYGDFNRALDEYQKIIDLDPDYKIAYSQIAQILSGQFGKLQESIKYYEHEISLDPMHTPAYNLLSYVYAELGQLDTALKLNDAYIALAPGDANPYDSRAEILALNGELDLAIAAAEKGLSMEPDFLIGLANLGHFYLFKRDYTNAEKCYKRLATSDNKENRAQARMMLSYIPSYKGQLTKSIEILDVAAKADELEDYKGGFVNEKCVLSIFLYFEMKDLENTRIMMDSIWALKIGGNEYLPYMLASMGEFDRAEEIAEVLNQIHGETESRFIYLYWQAVGSIELARGNYEKAVEYFEMTDRYPDNHNFFLKYLTALALIKSGRYKPAIEKLEKSLRTYEYNMAFYAHLVAPAHYLLGLAYDESGNSEKAIQKLEEFLDMWEEADFDTELIGDARTRLQRLKDFQS